MHRVVPEIIVENYRAGHFSGKFPAVGMFLDLTGFSFMTDSLMKHGQHGAEVLAALMHGVFDPLVESIFSYGGRIIGFAGDGIMALYPIDSDPATTALQALASAHGVQLRLKENPARETIYGTFRISAKIGLTSGSTTWGILRSEDGEDAAYYFRGTAVNDAARAEHRAAPGEIFLTRSMYELVQSNAEAVRKRSHYRFTGFIEPIPAPANVTPAPVDVDVSRRFMPEQVIVHDVRGEFRQIVNLFIRFPDLSDEALRDLMTIVFQLRRKYGGLVSRLDFGDKGCNMLILWGAPVAYENDIGRALNFVLDLRAMIDFPITTGVTYYTAHAGYLGSSMFEDYTCYGWGVNLASRFMMTAPPGSIWVDDRIARRVARRFDLEFVSQQPFKGFTDEQKVHLLRGYVQTDEVIYQGELVGREEELEKLSVFVEPLRGNRFAGLALVVGEAGIGKGRLVHEFRFSEFFEGSGTLWAVCQSSQILRQSFNPLRSWLMRYFGISHHQPEEERRRLFDDKLDALLASLPDVEPVRELERTRSLIAALVDLYWPDSLFERLDPEGRHNNTFVALISLLKAKSLRQPVVLFLEDLQFTDEDTKAFLVRLRRSLLASEEPYPIAIIVTSRPQEALEADNVDARIELGGLDRSAVARLVENLLGETAAPGLISFVVERSEGNPFFAEQIVRFLRDERMVETSAEGWALVEGVRGDVLPGDVRAILVARFDQLAHEVRTTIQTASVLGREFEVRVLARMLSDPPNFQESLADAERAAIWAPLTELLYIFSHGLLRDAAYSMQMRARRRELHALAMDALEELYAGNLKPYYAELAYHAESGGLRDKARHYYILAGRMAADTYQNHQGIEYYGRALIHTRPDDTPARFELLTERLDLLNRVGARPAQHKDLEELERLAMQLSDAQRRAKVDMLYAHYYIALSNYPAVVQRSEGVLKLGEALQDKETLLDVYRVWPLALLRQGKLDEAMRVAQDGLRLAESYGASIKQGYILNAMGLIAIEQRDPAVGHQYLERALSVARETGDEKLTAMSLENLGNSAGYIRQDYASALQYFREAYDLNHERGERSAESVALVNLGWLAGMRGEFQAARQYLEQALLISREISNIYVESYSLINLSAITGTQNDADASYDYARRGLELAQSTGDKSGVAWSLLYMGYALILLDDIAAAESCFRQSLGIRDELDQPGMRTEALAGLVQTHLLRDDLDAALEETEKIISYLEAGGKLDGTEEPLRVYYACYLTLAQAQDRRSRDVLDSAVRLLESQMARLPDEHSRRMYVENVPWRRAIQQAWSELTVRTRDTGRQAGRQRSG